MEGTGHLHDITVVTRHFLMASWLGFLPVPPMLPILAGAASGQMAILSMKKVYICRS